jgi:PAS domain S-box-containing protein
LAAEGSTTPGRDGAAPIDERYRALIENAYEIILEVDLQGQLLYANPTGKEITGYATDEVVGKSVFEYIHEEDRSDVMQIFHDSVVADRPGRAIYRYRHKDGRWRWLESAGRPYRGPGGARRVVIHSRDVTERVEAERALREQEERYRALAENVDDLIVELDEQGHYAYLSPNFLQSSGYAPAELIGRSPELHVHPDDWPAVRAAIEQGLAAGRAARVEYRARNARGHWAWIEAALRPLPARDGRPHLTAVCRDVTARKTAEEANASLAIALDGASDAVLVADARGTIRFANAAFAALVGQPASELLGRPVAVLAELGGGRLAGPLSAAMTGLRQGDQWTHTTEGRAIEGRIVHRRATVTRAADAQGRVTHFIASVRDISREVELEHELRQTQKLEALGTLAGGVAHDFNNLLTGILGYASMLRTGLRQEAEVREAAEVIESAALRGAELANQLLGFAGRGPQRSSLVDVHAVIRDVTRLLGRTIPRNVRVHERLGARRATIEGDRGQIQQVLLNLALNARDAMPHGGDLRFETEVEEREASADAPSRQLVVRVSDTGTGMSKTVQARIFEPFFTTKPPGQGSGMGLSVVYGIVTRHGGGVSAQSEEGAGTVFRLALPLVDQPREAEHSRPGELVRGSGRILVVDDEPAVRRVIARMLESLGYAVVALGDGREAVDYFRTRGAVLDLVIVDLDMPGMGGEECFRRLRELDPDVRVLVSTGLGPAGAVESLLAAGARGYLGKPYLMAQLSDAVARALAVDESACEDGRSG